MPKVAQRNLVIRWREGDERTYRVKLIAPDGRGAGISGWTAIEAIVRRADMTEPAETVLLVSTVQNSPAILLFTTASFDLGPGRYLAHWRVTDAQGKTQTFPTRRYVEIEVLPALG